MPAHESSGGNGGRNYLADEVRGQRQELGNLGNKVAGMDVSVTMLLEADRRAREHRDRIFKQIEAMRSEQQQVAMSTTAIQSELAKLSKTMTDLETERQQRAGALKLATGSARIAWLGLGVIGTAATAAFAVLYAWVVKLGGFPPPPTPGAHP